MILHFMQDNRLASCDLLLVWLEQDISHHRFGCDLKKLDLEQERATPYREEECGIEKFMCKLQLTPY